MSIVNVVKVMVFMHPFGFCHSFALLLGEKKLEHCESSKTFNSNQRMPNHELEKSTKWMLANSSYINDVIRYPSCMESLIACVDNNA